MRVAATPALVLALALAAPLPAVAAISRDGDTDSVGKRHAGRNVIGQKDTASPWTSPARTVEFAQSEQLLQVTPPEEVEAREPKLRIVEPAGQSTAPLLPIIEPARIQGLRSDSTALSPPPTADATPATPQPVGEVSPRSAVPANDTATPPAAPLDEPGTSMGETSASGPDTAVGPTSATGFDDASGPQTTVGPLDEMGAETAEGPVAVPLDAPVRTYTSPAIQVNPLQQPQGTLAAPIRPQPPARPVGPQGPRRVGN